MPKPIQKILGKRTIHHLFALLALTALLIGLGWVVAMMIEEGNGRGAIISAGFFLLFAMLWILVLAHLRRKRHIIHLLKTRPQEVVWAYLAEIPSGKKKARAIHLHTINHLWGRFPVRVREAEKVLEYLRSIPTMSIGWSNRAALRYAQDPELLLHHPVHSDGVYRPATVVPGRKTDSPPSQATQTVGPEVTPKS